MHNLITTINFGGVNCYLLQSSTDYILIDNGYTAKRTYVEKELERAGCKPWNLKLVVLTHGDHYEKTLGAIHAGGQLMVINTNAALKLTNKYFDK